MLSETVANVDFDAFYFAERKSLVRFVMFLGCGDANTAEDIAQTAFAKAFPVWATIRSPRAWLRTVAQNEFIRHCHTAARETSLEAGRGTGGAGSRCVGRDCLREAGRYPGAACRPDRCSAAKAALRNGLALGRVQ